jgi:2-phosphoglycerate kinase
LQSGKKATNNTVIAGFLSQAELVRVALEATIARALKEHQDIIVNGVHVLPSHLNLEEARKTAVVVQVTLAVTTLKRLGRQLQRRSREQPNRDSSRHRENLQAIWDIQTFMLDKAELSKTPVIVNWNPDETVRLILEQVMEEITRRFPPDPDALVR